ncbi:hypothetical protein LWI29_017589 [Acer saccharum]|uniref:Phytocyanin domain-containing protein n=1 Tax=Acer saccharum TaxID=4024 RepID=A0AA39S4B5_ACESA|nr:hypothetical protein LWI29_017589 [Acer saccharum]
MPRVLIPIANGSEEIEIVTIVDILRRAKVDVVVASVEKSMKIVASQGTKIIAEKLISNASEEIYDLIILPGGNLWSDLFFTGSPSKHGLLKEKRATAHPSVISKLTNEVVNGTKVVVDGKVITSRGLATVTDFALAIVSKLFGHGRARSVAEGLVLSTPIVREIYRLLEGSTAQSTVHDVGDAMGWIVPTGGATVYSDWAAKNTFKVNDVLVMFNFTSRRHDVAQVTKAAFDACNIASPISKETNSPANITLTSAGEHYYICTFNGHCAGGQKLALNVTSDAATPPPQEPHLLQETLPSLSALPCLQLFGHFCSSFVIV